MKRMYDPKKNPNQCQLEVVTIEILVFLLVFKGVTANISPFRMMMFVVTFFVCFHFLFLGRLISSS